MTVLVDGWTVGTGLDIVDCATPVCEDGPAWDREKACVEGIGAEHYDELKDTVAVVGAADDEDGMNVTDILLLVIGTSGALRSLWILGKDSS